MSKPRFSLMIIFWMMLTVCSFLAGRASTRGRLEQFEVQAIKAQLELENNTLRVESVVDTRNAFAYFIRTLEALGKVQILTGRALEVIDGRTFRFEEYDDSGQAVSQHTVMLKGINVPLGEEPFAKEARQLVSESLVDSSNEPFVIVLVPLQDSDSGNEVLKAYVASQSARNNWTTTVLQIDLVAAGLARIDEPTAVPVGASREREAQRMGVGIWSLP